MYKYLSQIIRQHVPAEELDKARNVLDTLKGQHMDALQPSPAPAACGSDAVNVVAADSGDYTVGLPGTEWKIVIPVDDYDTIRDEGIEGDFTEAFKSFCSEWMMVNGRLTVAPPTADKVCECEDCPTCGGSGYEFTGSPCVDCYGTGFSNTLPGNKEWPDGFGTGKAAEADHV